MIQFCSLLPAFVWCVRFKKIIIRLRNIVLSILKLSAFLKRLVVSTINELNWHLRQKKCVHNFVKLYRLVATVKSAKIFLLSLNKRISLGYSTKDNC